MQMEQMKRWRVAISVAMGLEFALALSPLAAQAVYADAKVLASDGEANDFFGTSVAVSGSVAIVGADGEDSTELESGAAYVYRFDGLDWNEEAKLKASDAGESDRFGDAVALEGDVALISASSAHLGAAGRAGAVYVFRYDGSSWIEEAKLTASDGAAFDLFGNSVSLSGNAALIGARADDDNGDGSGSAYVFRFNGSSWVEEAKLTAADGIAGDWLGYSVSIDGDRALVGSLRAGRVGPEAGAAYVYHFAAGQWVEKAKLTSADAENGDRFGTQVAISGDFVLIGADGRNDLGTNSGAAYVFHFESDDWVEEDKLVAADTVGFDFFGSSVSIVGGAAVIGADRDDDEAASAGAVYLFHREAAHWNEVMKVMAEDGQNDDQLGAAVSTDGSTVIAGATGDDDQGFASGSAYLKTLPPGPSNLYVPSMTPIGFGMLSILIVILGMGVGMGMAGGLPRPH